MRKSVRNRLLIFALALLVGCAGNVVNYKSKEDIKVDTVPESILWNQAEDFEKALRRSGQVVDDSELTQYLQSITDRLFPEYIGSLRIYAVSSPYTNAFALPNGGLYINLGLLSAFENEAQLASVIAHEGAHFTHRHGEKNYNTYHQAAGFGNFITAMGIPILGQFSALSVISGYSQQFETEADNEGFNRLKRAGYDISQSVVAFEKLKEEAKALDVKTPVLFSSHPKLSKRIEAQQLLIESNSDYQSIRSSNEEVYNRYVNKYRPVVLQKKLEAGHYKVLISLLAEKEKRAHYPNSALFFLGESYRLRAEEGDEERAKEALLEATKLAPKFMPSYRALGELYYKEKKYDEARQQFQFYKQNTPVSDDHSFVDYYLKKLKLHQAKQGLEDNATESTLH